MHQFRFLIQPRLSSLVLSLLFQCTAQAQIQASFDCSQATRIVDRIICGSAPLASADQTLATAYKAALVAATSDSAREQLRTEQRTWVKQRDLLCTDGLKATDIRNPTSLSFRNAAACMQLTYDQRNLVLQQLGVPALAPLTIETIPRAALLMVRKDLAEADADWEYAATSPDASMLGLAGGGRIWLYRRDNQRLIAVTPPPPVRGAAFSYEAISGLEGMRWAKDNSLYGWARRYRGDLQIFHATRDGPLGVVQAAPTSWPNSNSGANLSTTYRIPDPDNADDVVGNAQYVVWVQNRGHGSFDLLLGKASDAKTGAEPTRLVRGGHEMKEFLFDVNQSQIFYGTDYGIVRRDLASGAMRRITGSRKLDRLLDFSSYSQLLLFQREGNCEAKTGNKTSEPLPINLCLAKLPPG